MEKPQATQSFAGPLLDAYPPPGPVMPLRPTTPRTLGNFRTPLSSQLGVGRGGGVAGGIGGGIGGGVGGGIGGGISGGVGGGIGGGISGGVGGGIGGLSG